MLAPLVLATTFALAPSQQPLHVEATGSLALGYVRQDSPNAFWDSSNGFAGGQVDARVFLHTLHDDDAPPAFQPFMQRVGVLEARLGGGGGFDFHPNTLAQTTISHRVDASLAIDGYATRWLHLGAGAAVHDEFDGATMQHVTLGQEALRIRPWADIGVRFGDTLIRAGWSVNVSSVRQRNGNGAFNDPTVPGWTGWSDRYVGFWGAAYIDGYTVIARRLGIGAGVQLASGGALAHGDATLYFGRRLGFDLDVHGGRDSNDDIAGAGVGVRYWFTPRLAGGIGYRGEWRRSQQFGVEMGFYERDSVVVQTHIVSLSFTVR